MPWLLQTVERSGVEAWCDEAELLARRFRISSRSKGRGPMVDQQRQPRRPYQVRWVERIHGNAAANRRIDRPIGSPEPECGSAG